MNYSRLVSGNTGNKWNVLPVLSSYHVTICFAFEGTVFFKLVVN